MSTSLISSVSCMKSAVILAIRRKILYASLAKRERSCSRFLAISEKSNAVTGSAATMRRRGSNPPAFWQLLGAFLDFAARAGHGPAGQVLAAPGGLRSATYAIEPFDTPDTERFVVQVVEIDVGPAAVLALAMALNECAQMQ
jgi:hypothetical protein